jgi:hypothetical protein
VSSAAGRILDGLIDAVAPLSVFHGMAFFLLENGYGAIWIWPIGLATGASLIWHASVYDVNKNIYLHASRPDFNLGGATLMTQDDMRKMRAEFEQSGEKAFARLMTVWVAWTAPQMKALEPWTAEARTPANEAEREQFRALFRPAMRSLAWVGFGTHLFVLTMAALFAPLDPRAIWVAWALILVPMNVVCAWTELTRAGRVRRLEQSLAEMRADKEG